MSLALTNISDSTDTKREYLRLLTEQKRRKGLNDLHFFCKEILGYKDLTDKDKFHGEFCTHLENRERRFKLSLLPRGSLKSSIGTIGHPLQLVVQNPNIRILIASENFTTSTKYLAEIKGHIEKNDEFIKLYGNLKGNDRWTGSEIIVSTRTNWKKEPTISCAGIDVTKVGMHYDWIKVDDPQSEQNTNSQEAIDKVIRWYRLLLSLLDPGGFIDITGTIWHYNDLYSYLITKERERLEQGRKPRLAILQKDSFEGTNEDLLNNKVKKSQLLWPERLSRSFLKDQLIEQGPYIFSCQYRLRPIDDENAVFKRSWLKTYHPDELPDNLNFYSMVDPMRDDEGKDFLAIVTGGMSPDWKFYITDIRRLKADEHDTVDEMFDVQKWWKPLKIGFEAIAWQKAYCKFVTMLSIIKGKQLRITELKGDTTKTKAMRIKSMVPYFKAGYYLLPAKNGLDSVEGNVAILVDELTRYPKTANDDIADALSYINQLTRRPSVLQIVSKINPKSFKGIQASMKNKKRRAIGSTNVRGVAYGI